MTQAVAEQSSATLMVYPETLSFETREASEFIDVTDLVTEVVRRSRVRDGIVNVQSLHTTAAILINENEPLLIQDLKDLLQRLAPCDTAYRHDNFALRTINLCPEEEKNGHAHCRAVFLKTSETLNVAEGTIQLGPWQRIFLVELDRARRRNVSVLAMGHAVLEGLARWP
jgi:secondary thiamine-phosphate synthase enzyme